MITQAQGLRWGVLWGQLGVQQTCVSTESNQCGILAGWLVCPQRRGSWLGVFTSRLLRETSCPETLRKLADTDKAHMITVLPGLEEWGLGGGYHGFWCFLVSAAGFAASASTPLCHLRHTLVVGWLGSVVFGVPRGNALPQGNPSEVSAFRLRYRPPPSLSQMGLDGGPPPPGTAIPWGRCCLDWAAPRLPDQVEELGVAGHGLQDSLSSAQQWGSHARSVRCPLGTSGQELGVSAH